MRKLIYRCGLILALGLSGQGRAAATVLTFDDRPAFTQPRQQYANLGVHFTGYGPAEIQPGVSNSDPNGWGVDGSAGPYFLGMYDGNSVGLSFDLPVSSYSFDVLRPAGQGDTLLYISAYLQYTVVTNFTVTLSAGAGWTNLVMAGQPFNQVYWNVASGGRHAVDNIRYTNAPGSGPPVIYNGPRADQAYVGTIATVQVAAGGQLPLTFQWYFNSTPLAGATHSSLQLTNVQMTNMGYYTVAITNQNGGLLSAQAYLYVAPPEPTFTSTPYSQSVYAGNAAYFYAFADGLAVPTYQWQFQGTNLPGGTNNYLLLNDVQTNQAGPYRVIASNTYGSTTSSVATLTVLVEPPTFDGCSFDQTVSAGSHVDLQVKAFGSPAPLFHWRFNGTPISGEIKNVLKLYSVTSNQAGIYSVVASNISGLATNTDIRLSVVPPNSLDHWDWRSPSPQGNELSGVAYGHNLFASVGRFGAVVTSADGSNWTLRASGTLHHLYSVTHGGGRFVAVGSAGEVLVSTEGTNWTRHNSGTTRGLYAVIYANNQFIAAGRFGTILTSPNGTAWTAQTSGTSQHLRGLTYGAGQFVAVGSGGEILTSPDGNVWTHQVSGEVRNLRAVVHGSGTFVAVGNEGALLRSTDGTTWTTSPLYQYVPLRGISFVNGLFVTVGRYGYIYVSADALDWTYTYSPNYSSLYDLVGADGRIVAVGKEGTLAFSDNATNWVTFNPGQYQQVDDAAYGGGKFVGVGPYSPGQILTSHDGDEWNVLNIASNETFRAVAYGQDKFVVGGVNYQASISNHSVWTSGDAVHWTPRVIGIQHVTDLAYGLGRFVAVGAPYYYYSNNAYYYAPSVASSTNGETWTPGVLGPNASLNRVAAGPDAFVALDYYSFYRSTNGVDWTSITNQAYSYFFGLAAGHGKFVAVGYTYYPSYQQISAISADGLTWTMQPLPTTEYVNNVTFANGQFFIAAGNGLLLTSTNGTNWVRRNSATDNYLTTVAYGHSSHVLFGYNSASHGAILRSGNDAAEFRPPTPTFTGGSFDLLFEGELGRIYRVQYSTNFNQWFDLGSVTNTQRRMTISDPGAAGRPGRFYRLVSP